MKFRSFAFAFAAAAVCTTSVFASPRIVRGPGAGFYEAGALRGPAAQAVLSYLSETYVPCTDSKNGEGLCNLRASTESLTLLHSSEYAVAVIAFDNDTGNVPAVRIAMWRRAPRGFDLLGYKDNAIGLITGARAAKMLPSGLVMSGIVQGPNDAFCCPTRKAAYAVRYFGGEVQVAAATNKRP